MIAEPGFARLRSPRPDLPAIPSQSSWLRRSRSRTSSGTSRQFRHARFPGLQSRAQGNEQAMTDEQDRERESQQTDENKFVELADETAEETRQAAERLASDPIVNEPPEDK